MSPQRLSKQRDSGPLEIYREGGDVEIIYAPPPSWSQQKRSSRSQTASIVCCSVIGLFIVGLAIILFFNSNFECLSSTYRSEEIFDISDCSGLYLRAPYSQFRIFSNSSLTEPSLRVVYFSATANSTIYKVVKSIVTLNTTSLTDGTFSFPHETRLSSSWNGTDICLIASPYTQTDVQSKFSKCSIQGFELQLPTAFHLPILGLESYQLAEAKLYGDSYPNYFSSVENIAVGTLSASITLEDFSDLYFDEIAFEQILTDVVAVYGSNLTFNGTNGPEPSSSTTVSNPIVLHYQNVTSSGRYYTSTSSGDMILALSDYAAARYCIPAAQEPTYYRSGWTGMPLARQNLTLSFDEGFECFDVPDVDMSLSEFIVLSDSLDFSAEFFLLSDTDDITS